MVPLILFGDERSQTLEKFYSRSHLAIFLLVLSVLLLLFPTTYVHGYECVAKTYSDSSFLESRNSFTPYNKIFVKIVCKQLLPGSYNVNVNWVRHNHGVIRSDEQLFHIIAQEDRVIYFWIKLFKKGRISSSISGSNYSSQSFGEWNVEAYMNNELITSNKFTIN